MTDIIALDKRLKEINDTIRVLQAERKEVQEARRAYSNAAIKEFATLDEVVWEPKALNAASAFLSGWGGRRIEAYKPVLVDGQVYKRVGVQLQTPDYISIGQNNIVDVSKQDFWIQRSGANNPTSDLAIMKQRAREYDGALRQPLDTWKATSVGRAMREAYLETHEDPGIEYTQRNPSTLARYGNRS